MRCLLITILVLSSIGYGNSSTDTGNNNNNNTKVDYYIATSMSSPTSTSSIASDDISINASGLVVYNGAVVDVYTKNNEKLTKQFDVPTLNAVKVSDKGDINFIKNGNWVKVNNTETEKLLREAKLML